MKALKKSGYPIVMHQSLFTDTNPDQSALTDIIKLNLSTSLKPNITSFKKFKYLAADISTDEMFENAKDMGCSYYKGDFSVSQFFILQKTYRLVTCSHHL